MSYFLLCISVLLFILVMIIMKSKKYQRESSKSCNSSRQSYHKSNSRQSQKPRQYEYYDTRIKPGTIIRAKDTAQPPKKLK